MDNQNVQISGWNSIYDSGSTSAKITGTLIYHWRNLRITIGRVRLPESPLSLSYMGSTHKLIGRISHRQYHRWRCDWISSKGLDNTPRNGGQRNKSHGPSTKIPPSIKKRTS